MRPLHPGESFSVTRNPRNTSSFDWKIPSICAGFALILLATFYFFRSKPHVHEPVPVRVDSDDNSDFDRTLSLPGDPEGLAWNGAEFVMGNRIRPLGFLRLFRNEEEQYQTQQIDVRDQDNKRPVHIWTVAWTGKHYIGYTEGKNFDSHSRYVFTVHDPQTFEVIRHYPAPEIVGGLVWDGKGYWVATRKNTRSSTNDVYLYRYDPDFKMIDRTRPPDTACAGLGWDGSYLWFVDTFSSTIYLLNVVGNEVEVVHKYYPAFKNMSAIGFDGENIWVGEYDHGQLHRLNPELKSMWADGDFHIQDQEMAQNELAGEEAEPASSERPAPQSKIKPGEKFHVKSFVAERKWNSLYGSWNIHFDESLFANTSSDSYFLTYVKYGVTVTGMTLSQSGGIVSFDAFPGENAREDELLLENPEAGVYFARLFVDIQYVDENGQNRTIKKILAEQQISREP